MTTRGSKWQLNSGNLLFLLDSNLFFVLSIKDNHFFSIIMHYLIPFIFLLLVQFHLFVIISFIFFMKHFFHKIIPNIYFDHMFIRVFFYALHELYDSIFNFKVPSPNDHDSTTHEPNFCNTSIFGYPTSIVGVVRPTAKKNE